VAPRSAQAAAARPHHFVEKPKVEAIEDAGDKDVWIDDPGIARIRAATNQPPRECRRIVMASHNTTNRSPDPIVDLESARLSACSATEVEG
jgi:hypothetical protein